MNPLQKIFWKCLLIYFVLSFVSSILSNVSTVFIFIDFGININIDDLLTFNTPTFNAVLYGSAIGPFGALIYSPIYYIAMKYNAENVNEIVSLKYLIFIVAGGFSTYLTTHLLPINNDDFNINYKILKSTAVSMLVGYVIGAFFLFISSTIINIVEKKYGDSRVPVLDLVSVIASGPVLDTVSAGTDTTDQEPVSATTVPKPVSDTTDIEIGSVQEPVSAVLATTDKVPLPFQRSPSYEKAMKTKHFTDYDTST